MMSPYLITVLSPRVIYLSHVSFLMALCWGHSVVVLTKLVPKLLPNSPLREFLSYVHIFFSKYVNNLLFHLVHSFKFVPVATILHFVVQWWGLDFSLTTSLTILYVRFLEAPRITCKQIRKRYVTSYNTDSKSVCAHFICSSC